MKNARFGWSEIIGEDDDEGKVWFQIGLIEIQDSIEIVPDELAVVMLRSAERMERQFPGIKQRRMSLSKVIAEALTEYAENHNLDDDYFHALE